MTSPVADGLFEETERGVHLVGAQCQGCGTVYFPRALSCRNPDCHDKRLETACLPNRGIVASFTIQRYRPPPLFRMDDWEPYAIALVDLGEGLEVMGMLTGLALDRISIGMPVRVVLEALYTDEVRGPVVTYKFAPAEPS